MLSIATELNETNYLVPVGDTTITHFALSDEKGNVLLKEAPVGNAEHTDREACSCSGTGRRK